MRVDTTKMRVDATKMRVDATKMRFKKTCVYTVAACGEGRQSTALAGWGSPDLISNQADMI